MASALLTRLRALSGGLDQVFSSASNGLMVFAVAVVTDVTRFGQIAILITALLAVLGCQRGALGTPLMLKADQSRDNIRREGAYAMTATLVVSPALAALILTVGPELGHSAVLIAIAAPFVLAQDVLRYVVITEGRAHIAAIWDGIWACGTIALLVSTWLGLKFITTDFVLTVWMALAVIAFLGIWADVRLVPRIRGIAGWLAAGWRHRLRYGLDAGLEQVTVFIVLAAVTAMVSTSATAALRGATSLFAPVGMFGAAVQLIVIPHSTREASQPQQVWGALMKIATIGAFATALAGLVFFGLPNSIGRLLLGDSWQLAHQILPLIALEYVVACYLVPIAIFLRTFNRSAQTLTLKIASMTATIAGAACGGLLFGTAMGVAVGLAAGTIATTTLANAWFAPWNIRGRAASVDIAAPDSWPPRGSQPDNSPTEVLPRIRDGDGPSDDSWLRAHVTNRVPRITLPRVIDFRRGAPTLSSNGLIGLWTFGIMGVLAPIFIVVFTDPWSNLLWLGPVLIVVVASARFATLVGAGERRLSEMIFWAFTYAFLGLAPMVQLLRDEWPVSVPRSDDSYVWGASLIVLVGLLAFLGGVAADRVLTARKVPDPTRSAGVGGPGDFFTISYSRLMVLTAGAVVLNIYYLSKVGFIQFLKSREESFQLLHNLSSGANLAVVLRAASFMTILVTWLALVRFRREANRAARNGILLPKVIMRSNMVLIVIVGLLVANSLNPISNARYMSGTAMMAVVTAFGLFATQARFRVVAVGFLLGLLVIFPQADAFRYTREAVLKPVNPMESLLTPDYDSFAQIANGFLVTTREGIEVGRQGMGVLLFWIPRAIWSSKPVDTGIFIANSRGYSLTNLSAPLWVEFFINGGWVALCLGMLVVGFFLHRWDTKLDRDLQFFGMPSVLGSVLPFYLMILLRGSLLQAAPYLFFILVSWWFISLKRARSKPADGRHGPVLWLGDYTVRKKPEVVRVGVRP